VLTYTENESLVDENSNQMPGGTHEIHNPIYRRGTRGDPDKAIHDQPWSYRTWLALSVFRRDDLKYAVKVGIGAVLYAMWSFIEATRGFYGHWRGEWGLLSYMLVCSMVCLYMCGTSLKYRVLTTSSDNRCIQYHRLPAFCRHMSWGHLRDCCMDSCRRPCIRSRLFRLARFIVVFLHYCRERERTHGTLYPTYL
jgi:hypothetical protein